MLFVIAPHVGPLLFKKVMLFPNYISNINKVLKKKLLVFSHGHNAVIPTMFCYSAFPQRTFQIATMSRFWKKIACVFTPGGGHWPWKMTRMLGECLKSEPNQCAKIPKSNPTSVQKAWLLIFREHLYVC